MLLSILGDSGYMVHNYLLTPFLNPSTEGERQYNISLVQSRVKVENTFGIWKRRFPILAYGCRLQLETTLNIIVATAVLHNIAQLNGEPEPPLDNVNAEEFEDLVQNGNIPAAPAPNNVIRDFRRELVGNYFTRI
uniref:Nuclease HARBI1 n=1 Tax=Diabrotica virgifera virgifera TaxID=50390 RepID=A0A6P7H690_DIAVI